MATASTKELEREVHQWTLGSDQKLLEALKKFSASLGDKTQALVGKVDELSTDTVEVECKLRNTFNDFLMLADSQFIENVRACVCWGQQPLHFRSSHLYALDS